MYLLDNLPRTNNGKARRSQGGITRVLGRDYTATANEQIFHTPNLGVFINDRVSVILLPRAGCPANVQRCAWSEISGLAAGKKASKVRCKVYHAAG